MEECGLTEWWDTQNAFLKQMDVKPYSAKTMILRSGLRTLGNSPGQRNDIIKVIYNLIFPFGNDQNEIRISFTPVSYFSRKNKQSNSIFFFWTQNTDHIIDLGYEKAFRYLVAPH